MEAFLTLAGFVAVLALGLAATAVRRAFGRSGLMFGGVGMPPGAAHEMV